MTAHKDEGILMHTVTPPVLVLPAELPAWPLGTWHHPGTRWKHQEHPKNHGQAKFCSGFEANLARSTVGKQECEENISEFPFSGIYKSTKGSLMHLEQLWLSSIYLKQ